MFDLPFEGVKIAEFAWVVVGPLTTKYLADWGATVVRVESHTRPCILRLSAPFKDGVPGIDRSQYFAEHNSSKLSVSVDLNKPKGRELAWKLIMWADILSESYTPKAMKAWGLDYDTVHEKRPDIVYYSTCQQGHDGPHAHYPGYGQLAASIAGFYHVSGWPDRSPAPPYGAYTDVISPRFSCAALVAALDYARRTGKGQHLDQSQLETSLHFLAPALMDYRVNGRVASRHGNRLPYAAPHGAFRCKGNDRWVAIAVFDDREWQSLCEAMGDPEWAQGKRFATLTGRKQNEDELEQLVEGWTKEQSAEQVIALLQERGVAAHVVESIEDLFADPQLLHRGHFRRLQHPEIGEAAYDGPAFRLSGTHDRQFAAPTLGQHNFEVLTKILDLSDDEVGDLLAQGVLTTPEDFVLPS